MVTSSKKQSIKKGKEKKQVKKKSNTRWALLLFVLVFLTIITLYFFSPFEKKINKNSFIENIPLGFESFGIDVSHHQGEIDWDRLLNKEHYDTIIHFVYCKATEGNSYVDTKWEYNRETLNEFGIPNGAYHFFTTKEAPKPQVDHFLTYWKQNKIDLPPVLDVETEGFSDEDLRKKMKIWLEEVENRTGIRPIIYTSHNFFETKFKNFFPKHKFWIAAYSKKPTSIDDNRILHWQFSENGVLPGIDEEVDLNVSKVSF
jgi:lysozyme